MRFYTLCIWVASIAKIARMIRIIRFIKITRLTSVNRDISATRVVSKYFKGYSQNKDYKRNRVINVITKNIIITNVITL